MSDITRILAAIDRGEPNAAEQLLPLVYDELRRLAARRLDREAPGQTLQATALVHEAYVRLVEPANTAIGWDGRGHFFAAAAEAMRRILVERARRKRSAKRGGDRVRLDLIDDQVAVPDADDTLIALNEALDRLASRDPEAAELVKLRYFAGLTMAETARTLGLSERTAERRWTYARTFLLKELMDDAS